MKLFSMLFIGASVSLSAACGAPETIEVEQDFFDARVAGNEAVRQEKLTVDGTSINYASTGPIDATAIVYIHGTPGDWRGASRYLMDETLNRRFRMVGFDRPGWGGSSIAGKTVEPSFRGQAEFVKPLLQQLTEDNQGAGIVLVGHSLGASIAPRIAIEYPQLVTGMVLLSGSLDPGLGKPRWYNRLASLRLLAPAVNYFAPALLKANREIMPLKHELKAMQPHLQDIKMPVTVIQGLQDKLVYPGNIDYAETALSQADLELVRLPEAGHFTLWENRDVVTRAINDVVNKSNARKADRALAGCDNTEAELPRLPC